MDSITIEEVLRKTEVSLKSLKEAECRSDHLHELFRFCDPWRLIGTFLKLTDDKLNAIDGDHKTVDEKRLAVLKEWKQSRAFHATYLVLVQALVAANKIQNAVDLCEWFKENLMTHDMGRQPSPGQLVHSDSGYVSQPTLLESQQSTTTAAGYAMSQPLLESQQSMTAAAVDYEDAETVDYKSPASTPPPPPSVNPLFPLVNGHVTTDTPKRVFDTLKMFGYTEFQPGQEKAIMNVLSGISTLVILPIGSGKSLIYQLPAYLYSQSRAPESPCITLVVSPLISLMEDQVSNFPPDLKGACLHHTQSRDRQNEILRNAVEGRINVLLLSPETLVDGSLWGGRGTSYSLSRLPPVAFACVDEVHCISEWSHCFRPSYFCINKILRERLRVQCVLGLTATATHTTALSVASHLGIDRKYIIREGTIIPHHLNISITCVEDKYKALIELLQGSKFKDCKSIIVYCTRQRTTEDVAKLLNERLPYLQSDKSETSSSPKRRKIESTHPKIAGFYHSRVLASERDKIQKNFMDGRLRIIVATIAFGMGLNKRDIRAIIHYDIPKSFESFVQEIGRAGRDKKPAYCHIFVHKSKRDVYDLRTFAYGNTEDQATVMKLLNKAFPEYQSSVAKNVQNQDVLPTSSTHSSINVSSSAMPAPSCKDHEVAIPIDEMKRSLDMKEESILTLLCYLELQSYLKLVGTVKDSCILTWNGGQRKLRSLKRKIPVIAAAAKFNTNDDTTVDELEFSLVKVADFMEEEVHSVCSQLHQLHKDKTIESIEFSAKAFRIQIRGDVTAKDRYSACDYLCKKMKEQEERQLEKLHLIHAALSLAIESPSSPFDGVASMNNQAAERPNLRSMTEQYFSNECLDRAYLEKHKIPVLPLTEKITPEDKERVKGLIHSIRRENKKEEFTGRSIARIFHGIQSPRYPAIVWYNKTYWRLCIDHDVYVDFNTLCEIAANICGQ